MKGLCAKHISRRSIIRSDHMNFRHPHRTLQSVDTLNTTPSLVGADSMSAREGYSGRGTSGGDTGHRWLHSGTTL